MDDNDDLSLSEEDNTIDESDPRPVSILVLMDDNDGLSLSEEDINKEKSLQFLQVVETDAISTGEKRNRELEVGNIDAEGSIFAVVPLENK